MSKIKRIVSVLAAVIGLSFVFSGCGAAKVSPEVQQLLDKKEIVYTQFNMHSNPGHGGKQYVDTTNYGTGFLIPVNSEIVISKVNKQAVVFTYDGIQITLINKPKYSGLADVSQTISRYFSKNKVNLSKFSALEKKAIESDKIKTGISKNAMLVLRGYPPVHATPSLKLNVWKYWKNRWNTILVKFKDDKVSEIID